MTSVLPRLLRGLQADTTSLDLGTHLDLWGPLPGRRGPDLAGAVAEAGLRGHGGAWFPAATKWAAVRGSRGRPVVVANGAEGEPGSAKDALLLERLPHLVIDGAAAAAGAVRADRVILYAPARRVGRLEQALAERRRAGVDPIGIELAVAPDRFVAGQETAVVNALDGGDGRPTFAGLVPVWAQGVGGAPTLIHNVETLAHVALIARHGPAWYRQAGTAAAPGTLLLTVTGLDGRPSVVETQGGARLGPVVGGLQPGRCRAVLLGGYGGAWVDPADAAGLPLAEDAARALGATIGAGIVALLPYDRCPLAETARIVRYLDGEKADQCGPCVRGLTGMAFEIDALAFGSRRAGDASGRLAQLCDLVEGRGACKHPDGAARLVRSALRVFADEVRRHERFGPCPEAAAPPFLPTGAPAASGPGNGVRVLAGRPAPAGAATRRPGDRR